MSKDAEHIKFAVLATDVAMFTIRDGELYVRTIEVDRPPYYKNVPGLPGGLIHPKETAEQAAVRHINEKGGIAPSKVYIEQLYTFSDIDRDKRGRVVAVAYLALVSWDKLTSAERGEWKGARWVRVKDARKLAYDHDEILTVALSRMRSRMHYTTLVSKIMPNEFTLTDLEKSYESIVKTDLDKRNFRKKILKLKILKELPYKKSGGRFRPAQLYRFASASVVDIEVL
jgi:8-oxo-dGTP diphosphatase